MSTFLANTVTDAQTAITSLGGAVAGAISEAAGNYIVSTAGINASGGFGDVGLRFIIRALISSASFGLATDLMPDTSGNIMFSIIYFASNPSLVRDAALIGNIVVSSVMRLPYAPIPIAKPMPGKKANSCNSCE